MAQAPRHPSDDEREAAVRPTVAGLLRALVSQDGPAAAALLRDDAVWLAGDGRADGPEAAARARAFVAAGAGRRWADPQQRGAHAVLRWGDMGTGADGALVVEIRAGEIVLVCEIP